MVYIPEKWYIPLFVQPCYELAAEACEAEMPALSFWTEAEGKCKGDKTCLDFDFNHQIRSVYVHNDEHELFYLSQKGENEV